MDLRRFLPFGNRQPEEQLPPTGAELNLPPLEGEPVDASVGYYPELPPTGFEPSLPPFDGVAQPMGDQDFPPSSAFPPAEYTDAQFLPPDFEPRPTPEQDFTDFVEQRRARPQDLELDREYTGFGRFNLNAYELEDIIREGGLENTEIGRMVLERSGDVGRQVILLNDPNVESVLAFQKHQNLSRKIDELAAETGVSVPEDIRNDLIQEIWDKGFDGFLNEYGYTEPVEVGEGVAPSFDLSELKERGVVQESRHWQGKNFIPNFYNLKEEDKKAVFEIDNPRYREIYDDQVKALNRIAPNINWDFLNENEGGMYLDGYNPGGASGTTVGVGVDLGQSEMGEPHLSVFEGTELYDKLAPHTARPNPDPNSGRRWIPFNRQEAQQFLNENPLSITPAEAAALSKASKVTIANRAVRRAGVEQFRKLPKEFQTALMDRAFHTGNITPEMADAVREGDLNRLHNLVVNDRPQFPQRMRKIKKLVAPHAPK